MLTTVAMQLGEKPALFSQKLQKISVEEPPKWISLRDENSEKMLNPSKIFAVWFFFSLFLKFDFSFLDR